MKPRHDGNGHPKVTIQVHERGEGYVLLCPERIDTVAEGTTVYLSRTVENWLKDNPGVRVRCALPITLDGSTIAVHLWFDGEQGTKKGREQPRP